MNKNVSREFYNDLRFSKKSELDIYETIEEITDNDLVKLKALLNDLEWFLVKDINSPVLFDPVRNLDEEEKEWEERTYSIKWQGEEICKIKKPVTREGSNILQPLLDYETLPDAEYIPVCQIINLLQRRIRELQDKAPHKKKKPELNKALISFSSPEIIESIHKELKGYFQGKETELLKALKGEQLTDFLLFPHNQNKFVEVFKRLKYNGFLLSKPKEISNWICSNFTYIRTKGDKKEVQNFNESTIKTILTNTIKERQVEPTPKERICTPDWLPHYWSSELKNK